MPVRLKERIYIADSGRCVTSNESSERVGWPDQGKVHACGPMWLAGLNGRMYRPAPIQLPSCVSGPPSQDVW